MIVACDIQIDIQDQISPVYNTKSRWAGRVTVTQTRPPPVAYICNMKYSRPAGLYSCTATQLVLNITLLDSSNCKTYQWGGKYNKTTLVDPVKYWWTMHRGHLGLTSTIMMMMKMYVHCGGMNIRCSSKQVYWLAWIIKSYSGCLAPPTQFKQEKMWS